MDLKEKAIKEFIKELVYKLYEETKDVVETVYRIDQEIEEKLISEFIEEKSFGGLINLPENPEGLEDYVELQKRKYITEALKELVKILEAE